MQDLRQKLKTKSNIVNRHITYLIAGIFFTFVLDYVCPIRLKLGIPCFGCGMTRAFLAVLRLDFKMAFYYNPLFWFIPLYVWFLIHIDKDFVKGWVTDKQSRVIGVIGFLLILIVYLYRLALNIIP